MGTTSNFGFQKFGPEGRISDNAYRFSLSDRESIDALLWKLYNHNHSADGTLDTIPGPTTRPTLTLAESGGTIPQSTDLYYRVSFVDSVGNETNATAAAYVRTPDPIPSPEEASLVTASTGGTLEPGTYRYALGFYEGSTVTRAVNIASVQVPTGTSTNTITLTFPTIDPDADGWKIYRRAPSEDNYYLLDTVASGPSTYLDDGSVAPDCTKKRPTANTTNKANSVSVAISSLDLPLDNNIAAWRIYRSSNAGTFGANSLLAVVTETTTEGGTDLVTSFTDTGFVPTVGSPRTQSAAPPAIPQLSADSAFGSSARLPANLQPQGVQQFYTYIGGTLAAQTYNQFYIPNDMLVERIDVFFETGPTGVDGSNYVTVRVKDDSLTNEVQHVYNNAAPNNEIQRVSTDATSGTFTLSFDGQGPTAAIAYDALASTVETELELLSNITDVIVSGSGVASDPWVVEFVNPGDQDVAQMTANSTGLTGGTATVTTSIQGSDGGTFTLSDGTDTTTAIAYDALPGTVETRLQTDITAIVDVTVTGSGTSGDPWVVTYVDPANTDTPTLIPDDTLLNGATTVVEVTKGRGNTIVDVDTTTATQYYSWQSSTTDYGKQEAEDAPVTGNGVDVSDSLAANDVAAEIDAQSEVVAWNIGTLDAATYTFGFYVADVDNGSTIDLEVVDLPSTVLASRTLTAGRGGYEPVYTLEYDIVGTEDVELRVTKTDANSNRVRVDYFEYQAAFPTLYQGQTGSIEVAVTGSPSTNGGPAHVTVWY